MDQDQKLLKAAAKGQYFAELERQRLADIGATKEWAAIAGYYEGRLLRFISKTKELYDDKD